MGLLANFPLYFLYFWFVDAPKNMVAFFLSLNSACAQLFSLSLLVKTYFKPWKNEYREGLVGFSIAMGIFVKTIFLLVGLLILAAFCILELAFILAFIAWPFATIALLFM